jgi:anaerobic selenocysteine-containing dehydrogenase
VAGELACHSTVTHREFFRRLAAQMGFHEPYLYDSDEALIHMVLASAHAYLHGTTFERLWQQGWARLNLPEDWRPFAEGNFPTPSGKCEFYAESLPTRGLDPLPGYVPAVANQQGPYPLHLLSTKTALPFLNSSYANLERHRSAERQPVLDRHPHDAAVRNITDGEQVHVFNHRGTVELQVRVGSLVRPGVVTIPSGWWAMHSPGGVSVNVLTSDGLSDLGGGGDGHDTLVEVTA